MITINKVIKGEGRGKQLGYPTINFQIPKNFILKDGVYAVKLYINKKEYLGALHYGPIPTFKKKKKSLEVHLIDVSKETLPKTSFYKIKLKVLKKIREIIKFNNEKELKKQISKDIKLIKNLKSFQ